MPWVGVVASDAPLNHCAACSQGRFALNGKGFVVGYCV